MAQWTSGMAGPHSKHWGSLIFLKVLNNCIDTGSHLTCCTSVSPCVSEESNVHPRGCSVAQEYAVGEHPQILASAAEAMAPIAAWLLLRLLPKALCQCRGIERETGQQGQALSPER